jgi:hypothetical protein
MAIDGRFTAGESFPFRFTITDSTGAPLNLIGTTLRWSIGREVGGGPLVTKTQTDMTISGAGNNVVSFTLLPADTAALGGATYRHELMVIDGSGRVYYPVRGLLIIDPHINDPTP